MGLPRELKDWKETYRYFIFDEKCKLNELDNFSSLTLDLYLVGLYTGVYYKKYSDKDKTKKETYVSSFYNNINNVLKIIKKYRTLNHGMISFLDAEKIINNWNKCQEVISDHIFDEENNEIKEIEPDKFYLCDKFIHFQRYQNNTRWEAIYKRVKIPFRYVEKYLELQKTKELNTRKNIKLKEEIEKIRETTYSTRLFPPKLREIILQRDNRTCQLCGRTLENCIKTGLNLEVDHIVPWEDGGFTGYKNGRTVCSECNKGRHSAKIYKKKINEISI